jgi:hypothetical protein
MATTYDALGSYTVSGSSTASITLSSLPTSYTDLVLTGTHALSVDNNTITVIYNNDSGSNYPSNSAYIYWATNYFIQGDTDGSSAIRNQAASGYPSYSNWAGLEMYITEYGSSKWKNTLYRNTTATNSSLYYGSYLSMGGSTWKNTAAITSIKISAVSGTFTAGTVFSLYGITAG